MKKQIEGKIDELKTGTENGEIEIAQKAAMYLLKNALFLSETQSVEVAGLIPKLLEKARKEKKEE